MVSAEGTDGKTKATEASLMES